MTAIYLALGGAAKNLESSFQQDPAPAVLLSYMYHQSMVGLIDKARLRYWVLDSGAFTAHQQGKPIKVDDYIAFCKDQLQGPNPPKEVYSLDVIGDHVETARNTEKMWKAGIPAIPTFHINEPEDALLSMAKQYPKLALGGVAGMNKKALPWLKQCFARVWPKPMHLFGIHSEEVLLSLPFHSADATNWQLAPTAFGNWGCYGGAKLGIRKDFHLRPQVEMFLDLERKLEAKWGMTLKRLDSPSGKRKAKRKRSRA